MQLADDHAITREGLQVILERSEEFEVVTPHGYISVARVNLKPVIPPARMSVCWCGYI